MQVSIRAFRAEDIPYKIRWINDPDNNRYLHYNLPLTEAGTTQWFQKICHAKDRYDCTITANGVPCGVIGLLRIDSAKRDAEYYITVGEPSLKRKGIAVSATKILMDYAFSSLRLDAVYLYTEPDNLPARNLFCKLGFTEEPHLIYGIYPGEKPAICYRLLHNNSDMTTES